MSRNGRHMYRNWFITGAGPDGTDVRIQYPRFWIHYFGQPIFYLSSPTGNYSLYYRYLLINLFKTTISLDIWTIFGAFKQRTVLRSAINARETFPVVHKITKFHSALTHCSLVPKNWLFCPLGTP